MANSKKKSNKGNKPKKKNFKNTKFAVWVRNFMKEYTESSISAFSAQSAFFLMLAFFPFMLFFFTILNLTPLSKEDFMLWMGTLIPDTFQGIINSFSDEIYAGNTSGRLSLTVVFAIYLSSKAFLALQQGLNSMYHIKEKRNPLLIRVFSFFYSIVFAVFLIVVLAILVFGNEISNKILYSVPVVGGIVRRFLEFRVFICFPVLFLFFMMIYFFLPDWRHCGRKRRIKTHIPGSLFSASGWIILSEGFSFYVNHSSYGSFYGAMTTIALVMVWLYWCMFVIFIGGLLNR